MTAPQTGASRPTRAVRDDETAGDSLGDTIGSTSARPRATVHKRADRTGPDREQTASADRSDEQLVEAVRELADRSTGPLSTYAIKQALKVGSARAARLLAQLDPVPAGLPATNGQARVKEAK
ncbi:MAG: hypothetical protein ACRDTH_08930 [Pseudonocardiaceae bacterium]